MVNHTSGKTDRQTDGLGWALHLLMISLVFSAKHFSPQTLGGDGKLLNNLSSSFPFSFSNSFSKLLLKRMGHFLAKNREHCRKG
jgi:hypothetical protein